MDYNDFEAKLETSRGAVIIATLGNTITSAIDNVRTIRNIIQKKKVEAYVHADAAFDGMILPFIKTCYPFQLTDGIDSISISGHKIIGAPLPCGIVLIHKKYIDYTKRSIDIIDNFDCTVTGSRAGFASLILWEAIFKNKYKGFQKFIEECLEKAERFTNLCNQAGVPAWKFEHAMTIVLDRLPEEITKKWRAPSNNQYTTLTALPKLTEKMLRQLLYDIKYFKQYNKLPTINKGISFPKISKQVFLE